MSIALRSAVAVTAVMVVLVSAVSADAALRSPRLTDDCQSGREYAEYVFGPFRIEGCTEEETPKDDEVERRRFFGDVEVNGLIVEGNSPLIATIEQGDGERINRLHRSSSKLVLDPLILGARRRIVMYSGTLDLEVAAPGGGTIDPQRPNPPPGAQPIGRTAATVGVTGTVDLPVSGVPALLGLRIRDQIEDAKVTSGGPGSFEFRPPTSLGATASALLRDWTGRITIKTIDGTGMTVEDLRFRIPDIEIPGIGGFKDLSIRYSADDDEWSGSIFLDLGEALFTLDLKMSVSASTGAPTEIRGRVDNLNIPIGQTGIFLQSVNAAFDPNPMFMGVGASATAGPEFGGLALVEMSGQLDLQLEDRSYEPHFRLEAGGNARVFPTSPTAQLATGDMDIVIDEDGFISIGGEARYELVWADLGISADIGGSGAYSTTSDIFNIEAHATGRLHLGFLGTFDVVRMGAVVSSEGWGVCGNLPGLLFLVKAGIGQDWDHNPKLILGCDLSPFSAVVPGARAAQQPRAAEQARRLRVPRGVKTLAIEATANAAEPRLAVQAPNGSVVATTVPLGQRAIGRRAAVIAQPGSPVQYVFVRNPAPGLWRVRAAAGGPRLTGLRVARDMPPLRAAVGVQRLRGRPGLRRLRVRGISGVGAGERVAIGLRTPVGIRPLGVTGGRSFSAVFDEMQTGRVRVVATVLRDGIPLATRTRTIGSYRAKLPAPARAVRAARRGRGIVALALPASAAERPDRWQYILRAGPRKVALKRSVPGRAVRFRSVRHPRVLTVSVRPVVGGRALPGRPTIGRVR